MRQTWRKHFAKTFVLLDLFGCNIVVELQKCLFIQMIRETTGICGIWGMRKEIRRLKCNFLFYESQRLKSNCICSKLLYRKEILDVVPRKQMIRVPTLFKTFWGPPINSIFIYLFKFKGSLQTLNLWEIGRHLTFCIIFYLFCIKIGGKLPILKMAHWMLPDWNISDVDLTNILA